MGDTDGEAEPAPATMEDLLRQSLADTAEQKLMITQLIAAWGGHAPVAHVPAVPSDDEIRRDKFLKLFPLIQKSQKVKDFKEGQDETWSKWYDRYKTELNCLGNINCNLDLLNHPITQVEYMQCLQLKLEHDTKKRLESAFLTNSLTWQNVTILQIEALMLSEFGSKEPDIASVLACFGPDRFKKAKEMPVSQYYYKFKEKLPECLKPNTNEEFKAAIDLVHRTIFYQGLNDRYIEKELCTLKGNDLNLKKFLDEAIAAEARQKTFDKTGDRCNELTPVGIASISKSEFNSGRGNSRSKPWWSDRRGRGRGGKSDTTTDTQAAPTDNVGHGAKPKRPPLTCWNSQEVGHNKYFCSKKNTQ